MSRKLAASMNSAQGPPSLPTMKPAATGPARYENCRPVAVSALVRSRSASSTSCCTNARTPAVVAGESAPASNASTKTCQSCSDPRA
jgi:hypothetical protein